MITIQELCNAYPGDVPVDPETVTFDDIELASFEGGLGDSLFMFLCYELCDPDDEIEKPEAVKRLSTAIRDVSVVRDSMLPVLPQLHLAKIVMSQLYSLVQMKPGEHSSMSFEPGTVLQIKHQREGEFTFGVNGGEPKAVGNICGVMEAYLQTFFLSKLIVLDDV